MIVLFMFFSLELLFCPIFLNDKCPCDILVVEVDFGVRQQTGFVGFGVVRTGKELARDTAINCRVRQAEGKGVAIVRRAESGGGADDSSKMVVAGVGQEDTSTAEGHRSHDEDHLSFVELWLLIAIGFVGRLLSSLRIAGAKIVIISETGGGKV